MTCSVAERITFTLHHLVGALDAYADGVLLARHGVTFNHFHFLAVLSEEEPVDMTTLAACLGITKAAVSKRVPSLVRDGWIATSSEPGSGRRVLLSLTSRGADLVRLAGGELDLEFREMWHEAELDGDTIDIARTNRLLEALIERVQQRGRTS